MKLFLFFLLLLGMFGTWLYFLFGPFITSLCLGLILAMAMVVNLMNGTRKKA